MREKRKENRRWKRSKEGRERNREEGEAGKIANRELEGRGRRKEEKRGGGEMKWKKMQKRIEEGKGKKNKKENEENWGSGKMRGK